MTGMVGLKRILFPLKHSNFTENKQFRNQERNNVSMPFPPHEGAIMNDVMTRGDSLASLGVYNSKPKEKVRRGKRDREKENGGSDRGFARTIKLTHKGKGAILDSLALLGEGSWRPPKPVSPLSIELKRKTKKKTNLFVKQKHSKKAISGTAMPKNTRKYLKALTKASDTRHAAKKNVAKKAKAVPLPIVVSFSAPTGLGAMFGAEFAPMKTRLKRASVERPTVIETNAIILGIVSPLPEPCTRRMAPASEAVHSSDRFRHNVTERSPVPMKPNPTATKRKSIKSNAVKMAHQLTSISTRKGTSEEVATEKLQTSEKPRENPKRRSKRERNWDAPDESFPNLPQKTSTASPNLPPKDATEKEPKSSTSPKKSQCEDEKANVANNMPLRRSKRRRSTTVWYSPSCAAASSIKKAAKLESNEVASEHLESISQKASALPSVSADPSTTSDLDEAPQSRRPLAPPDRLGIFVGDPGDLKTLGRGICTKNSRCASTREKGKAGPENINDEAKKKSIDNDAVTWTSKELDMLRKSHQEANPKSLSFWDDVAVLVGSKNAGECQEKWFSFAKTPAQAARKSRKKWLDKGTPGTKEDDIFNATPMKALCDLSLIFGSGFDLGNAEGLATIGIGSAIKVNAETTVDNTSPHLNMATFGYKTYIKNVKRDVNKSSKRKIPRVPKWPKNKKTLALKDTEGDFEVQGKLSPGGTVRVATESVDIDHTADEDIMYLSDGDDRY